MKINNRKILAGIAEAIGAPDKMIDIAIAIDKYDNVYVTDPQSDPGCSQQPRVLKFDSEGNFITKWGSYGKGDGQFRDPEHLAVDSQGNVYVSDRKNENIQVFEPIIK